MTRAPLGGGQIQMPVIRPASSKGDQGWLEHPDRLTDLFDTGLMDSEPEPGFDRLTRLTCKLLNAPMSLVSLVDNRRQYFKSQVGLPPELAQSRQTPLSHSLCRHVVESDRVLVIGDISQSTLVCNNPNLEEVRMLSYVGVPLRSAAGRPLGSLCAIDDRPRKWTEDELDTLVELAGAVETEIRLRTELVRHARTREDLERTTQAWMVEAGKGALVDIVRVLLRDTPNALAMLDTEMCYLAHSRRWIEDFRLPCDDLVGLCHYDVFPELPERFRARYDQVLRGERVSVSDESFLRRDGRTEHIAYQAVPWYGASGQVGGVLILSEVLTEARRTYQELQTTLAQVRQTEATLQDTVRTLVATQRLARIEQWSWELSTGRLERDDPDQSRRRSSAFPSSMGLDEFLRMVEPDDLGHLTSCLEKARSSPRRITESFTVRTSDGRAVHCYLDAVPVWNESGVLARYVGAIQDQTRQRDLESRLFGEQKLQALGQVASGFAHDFNNVLSVIRGFTDLLSEDLAPDSPQQGDLKEIRDAAEQGRRLAQQLLMFVRKKKPGAELLDLNGLIREREQMLGLFLKSTVALRLDLQAPAAQVRWNRSQLEQLLLNFVGNAGDAIDGDAGQVTVITEQEWIAAPRICADGGKLAAGRYVRLTVRDNGKGIGAERARIFEPLFTTKDEGKGTGLGLSVCATLVREAQGAIDLESQPGQGTSFHIYLPLAEDVDPAAYAQT